MKRSTCYFGPIAFLLAGVGLLLFFEIIRPFRDMSIDGPLALAAWGLGVTLSIVALIARARWVVVNVAGLVVNALLLLGAAALLWAISRSNFLWH
ncbi:MAG: hypothetical protein ACXWG0_07540 [Chthoniobacterales bacterium]